MPVHWESMELSLLISVFIPREEMITWGFPMLFIFPQAWFTLVMMLAKNTTFLIWLIIWELPQVKVPSPGSLPGEEPWMNDSMCRVPNLRSVFSCLISRILPMNGHHYDNLPAWPGLRISSWVKDNPTSPQLWGLGTNKTRISYKYQPFAISTRHDPQWSSVGP